MEDTIVLYPFPVMGHIVSTVELGKLILKHYPSFSVTIFLTTPPPNAPSTTSYINRISTTNTSPFITFHHLPPVSAPPPTSSTLPEELMFELPKRNNSNLHQALQNLSRASKIRAFIIDFFCNASFEVSTNLNIPTYYFYTSGASVLSVFLYIPTLHETATDVKSLPYIELPSIPRISASRDLPNILHDKNSNVCKHFISTSNNMAKSSGVLANTFVRLEERAVKAISEGKCIPNGPTPGVYHIGPLIGSGSGNEHECLSWLDSQPSQSVVFLCFGSMGYLFSNQQLKEMAIGLENSGHRFLWVVRSPPTGDDTQHSLTEPNLDELFPEGFLERTKERGFVVKNWAPQVAVLNHDSVGGFVTHCGWNSVLEAVCHGVPMVGWPLYAEQRMNRVFMVEELKVALPLDESEDGFVSGAELEKRVRELMEMESGKMVREKIREMKDEARAAMEEGGSSRVALAELTQLWKKG